MNKPYGFFLKGVLERNKKRKQKTDTTSPQTKDNDYGFVRGAKYFGRDNK
jgi:hypothetical protein